MDEEQIRVLRRELFVLASQVDRIKKILDAVIGGGSSPQTRLQVIKSSHERLLAEKQCSENAFSYQQDVLASFVYISYPEINKENCHDLIDDDDLADFVDAWVL